MSKPRMVRDFPAPPDPWPVVERWAAAERYRCVAAGVTRTFRKGSGLAVGARIVQVGVMDGWMRVEAWVASNALARVFSLGILPREITVEPGGFKAVIPRRMGQKEVDGLLEALGQPSVLLRATAPAASPAWITAPVAATPLLATMAGPTTAASPPSTPLPPPPGSAPVGLGYPTMAQPPQLPVRPRRRWPLFVGLALVLAAVGAFAIVATSTESIEDQNAAAAAGQEYATPKALTDEIVAGGVPCTVFRKGDTLPGALGTIIARSGDCTVDGQSLTATVFSRGPIMRELMDEYVTDWLDAMRAFDDSPLILVGPNWLVWATDDQVLFDVQEAIGGTLQE